MCFVYQYVCNLVHLGHRNRLAEVPIPYRPAQFKNKNKNLKKCILEQIIKFDDNKIL